ncbi:MAG TPA: hypothetical protein VKA46_34085 [Gemmataceae bacterium]|nr:hypothetical protein [Gemmataceae bacterium]
MDTGSCPLCGLRRHQWRNEVGRWACEAPAGRRPSVVREMRDRLMNWLVGVLLVATSAALVVVQANLP